MSNNLFDYPIHILELKMWHHNQVKDKWNQEIELHGPDENSVKFYNEAHRQSQELEHAILTLKDLAN